MGRGSGGGAEQFRVDVDVVLWVGEGLNGGGGRWREGRNGEGDDRVGRKARGD